MFGGSSGAASDTFMADGTAEAYAGGIVGIGSGYIYRATLEHDDATQKLIEEGYKNYYQGGEEV